MTKLFKKDPDEVLDYVWDLSNILAEEEVISQFILTVQEGITLDSSMHDDNTVTAWISGGTLQKHYLLDCKITTSSSRVFDRDILIYIENK